MAYGQSGAAWGPLAAAAILLAASTASLAGCENATPAGGAQDAGPPAGVLVVTLKPAIEGVEIRVPARIRAGAQEANWSPGESATLSNLDPRATHPISVQGPYLADPLEVTFADPSRGEHVEVLVLPSSPRRDGPSEPEQTPGRQGWMQLEKLEKRLEIELSADGPAKANWRAGSTIISTFDVPAAGLGAETFQQEWTRHANHNKPEDPQKDALRLSIPEGVSVARVVSFYAGLHLPKRKVKTASGLREVSVFDLRFGRPAPPPPESVPLDDALRALTEVDFEASTAAGFDKRVREALRSCESALCTPDTITGGWERLAVNHAAANRAEEAEEAFFVARMSRLRFDPDDDVTKHYSFGKIVEPDSWLDESNLPESARKPYRRAMKRKMPRIRHGATSVTGRLEPAEMVHAVLTRVGPMAVCYAMGLRENTHLQGRMAVGFVIGTDGHVGVVVNGGADLPDDEVLACVLREFHRLPTLVPEEGIVTVIFPMMMSPAR